MEWKQKGEAVKGRFSLCFKIYLCTAATLLSGERERDRQTDGQTDGQMGK
jgi:hypothetical protein